MNIFEKNNIQQVLNTADYFKFYKRIAMISDGEKDNFKKKIRIAFLSSFTSNGFKEILSVKCLQNNIFPEFYNCDYKQYSQDIIDGDSNFYAFNPDITILFIDAKTLLGEYYFNPYDLNKSQRKDFANEKISEICRLVETIKGHSNTKILLHNIMVPSYSPHGIVENKHEFGFLQSVAHINHELACTYRNDEQIFVFDYESFCSTVGKNNITDTKMYYLADMKVDMQMVPALCNEYMSYIKPATSSTKKCIVLDLDDTLWGGVIGEDGLEGIKLGPTPEGRAFWEFQKYLFSLFKRGVILAINSKNNIDDVLEVFEKHPHMVLKENHFAAMQINWNDKATNMRLLSEELNIGVDSFVFFDNDKLNREIVSSTYPEITVVDLPSDSSLYCETLQKVNDFNSFYITDEDMKKGQMYVDQRKRKEFKSKVVDLSDYLKSLEMKVEIQKINDFNKPRIAQLTQKTNQFNVTTRRYTDIDLDTFSKRGDLIVSIRVEDKFGDNGITGAAIVQKEDDVWKIDTFLLSCRVIGRKVEEVLLGHIIDQAKNDGVTRVIGEFIQTKKNIPSKDFFGSNKFKLVKDDGERQVWEYDVTVEYNHPDFIDVIIL